MNSTIETAAKIMEELRQLNENNATKQEGIQHRKPRLGESLKKKLKKSNAGPVHYEHKQLISEEETFLWLSRGDLRAETEGEIESSQAQALQTKCNATNILETETGSKCRVCQRCDETIYHITSACPILAKEQCIKRHDKSVCPTTLQHMQGNRSKTGKKNTGMSMYQNQYQQVKKVR